MHDNLSEPLCPTPLSLYARKMLVSTISSKPVLDEDNFVVFTQIPNTSVFFY
jgi:hypothetical protein